MRLEESQNKIKELTPKGGQQAWLERVEQLAKEVSEREGCIFYDLEFVGAGQGRTLRLYIDKAEGQVGIDDCSNVSKGLNLILDSEDVVPGDSYLLEVSTPGLDRLLRQPWHFERVKGEKIYVRALKKFEDFGNMSARWKTAKTIEGELVSVSETGIGVKGSDGEVISVPFSFIEKSKKVFELVRGEARGHNPNKVHPKFKKKK